MNKILLGVNIDHVATVRQARRATYPDTIEAAIVAEKAGADGITLHLREDRRHIQDFDVENIRPILLTKMNLEMAVTDEMIAIALKIKPSHVCLVPEKRVEITTEGGLDITTQEEKITAACRKLAAANIDVSLFIDPDLEQISAAKRCGAPTIEITTGAYAEANTPDEISSELRRIVVAVEHAEKLGLVINAGHGLNYQNVHAIAAIPQINELNIGHSIIARAVFVGLETAVREMKTLMLRARGNN